jgi:hypothetical protein
MRSSTVQAFISELETEEVESFTDTALGDDLTDLRRAMDRIESSSAAASTCSPAITRGDGPGGRRVRR